MCKADHVDFRNYHDQWRLMRAIRRLPIDFFSSDFQSGTEEQRRYRERKFREHFLKCRQCRRYVRTRPIHGFENTVRTRLITLPKWRVSTPSLFYARLSDCKGKVGETRRGTKPDVRILVLVVLRFEITVHFSGALSNRGDAYANTSVSLSGLGPDVASLALVCGIPH